MNSIIQSQFLLRFERYQVTLYSLGQISEIFKIYSLNLIQDSVQNYLRFIWWNMYFYCLFIEEVGNTGMPFSQTQAATIIHVDRRRPKSPASFRFTKLLEIEVSCVFIFLHDLQIKSNLRDFQVILVNRACLAWYAKQERRLSDLNISNRPLKQLLIMVYFLRF